jgi:hypothetical protein
MIMLMVIAGPVVVAAGTGTAGFLPDANATQVATQLMGHPLNCDSHKALQWSLQAVEAGSSLQTPATV